MFEKTSSHILLIILLASAGMARADLFVTPASNPIDSSSTNATSVDLVVNANNLFAIDVDCVADTNFLTLADYTPGDLFPASPQSLAIDNTDLASNRFALATSLSAAVDNGVFVPAPPPITATGTYATLNYTVQPVSGITDITCTALGANSSGAAQPITVLDANIILDNGINAVGVGQTISGTVVIPAGIDPATVVVTLTIGAVSATTGVDADGNFSFDDIRDGDAVISVDAGNTVARCVPVNIVGGPIIVNDLELERGDINGDGVIDHNDFTELVFSFGRSAGDSGFNPDADLNEDGTVNIQDLAILAFNFGLEDCAFGDNAGMTTAWYGYQYALEFNSIRAIDDDDNPFLEGYIIDAQERLLEKVDQADNGSAYLLEDVTAFNVSFTPSTVNPAVFKSNFQRWIQIVNGDYRADINLWTDDEVANNAVDIEELRARVGVFQKSVNPPYPLERPTLAYDFTKIAGKQFVGATIDPDSTTNPDGFSFFDNAVTNRITLGASPTDAISGYIDTLGGLTVLGANDTFENPLSTPETQLLANHATYVALNTVDNRSMVIVASPDGNAIAVGICHDNTGIAANCLGNQSDVEQAFDIDSALDNLDRMTFSLLIAQ